MERSSSIPPIYSIAICAGERRLRQRRTGGRSYLWSQKILHLDYLGSSHPEADHLGGFGCIASNFNPTEFWARNIATKDQSYPTTLIAMTEAHVGLVAIPPKPHSTYCARDWGDRRSPVELAQKRVV